MKKNCTLFNIINRNRNRIVWFYFFKSKTDKFILKIVIIISYQYIISCQFNSNDFIF